MDWISVSKVRGMGAMSGGILLALCILFLDHVIMGWEFGCSKLGFGGAFEVEGEHESSASWFGRKERVLGIIFSREMQKDDGSVGGGFGNQERGDAFAGMEAGFIEDDMSGDKDSAS